MQMRMRFFFYQNNKIAVASASFSHIPFTAHAELHPFLNTCRNIQCQSFFAIYSSFAFAYSALTGNYRSFAPTGRTRSNSLHLSEKSVLHSAYLSTTSAGTACLNTAFIFCSGTATSVAGRSEERRVGKECRS